MARKANAGEGSLGMMLNNPDLYNALTDAAVRLERTLVEIQLFIQKVKAELETEIDCIIGTDDAAA